MLAAPDPVSRLVCLVCRKIFVQTLYTIKFFITSLGGDLRPDLRVAWRKYSPRVTSVRYCILKQFCHTSHSVLLLTNINYNNKTWQNVQNIQSALEKNKTNCIYNYTFMEVLKQLLRTLLWWIEADFLIIRSSDFINSLDALMQVETGKASTFAVRSLSEINNYKYFNNIFGQKSKRTLCILNWVYVSSAMKIRSICFPFQQKNKYRVPDTIQLLKIIATNETKSSPHTCCHVSDPEPLKIFAALTRCSGDFSQFRVQNMITCTRCSQDFWSKTSPKWLISGPKHDSDRKRFPEKIFKTVQPKIICSQN